jgi:hypothetical protein
MKRTVTDLITKFESLYMLIGKQWSPEISDQLALCVFTKFLLWLCSVGWWLMLICYERKVPLTYWCQVARVDFL